MIRLLLPIATIAAVFMLGDALADSDWLVAAALGVLVIFGLIGLVPPAACDARPASAQPPRAVQAGRGKERGA